jgi:hypothetical protein
VSRRVDLAHRIRNLERRHGRRWSGR